MLLLVAIYSLAISQPGAGVIGLLISLVFVGLGFWVLNVSWMRKLMSKFESSPMRYPRSSSISSQQVLPNLDYLYSQLLNFPRRSFRDTRWIPNTGGVYAIYDERSALYVGRTNNLYRRLKLEHLLGQGNSALMRELMSRMGFGEVQVEEYLRKSCSFQYVHLTDERIQTDLEHHVKLRLHPYINF